jgi:small subunit ribosomal protein S9
MQKEKTLYATGKRKTAIARTWLKPGTGEIIVNGHPVDEYFKVPAAKAMLLAPLVLTNTIGTFDVVLHVTGGGINGQAGAARHGITKALILSDPELRASLKRVGFVRRDPRQKERKKYGQKGPRARFQSSKR